MAKSPRARMLKYNHGITEDQYNTLAEYQDHSCAICNTRTRLDVDHNHKTGFIRGLLCRLCNTALGLLKDKRSNLIAAYDYLEEPT